MDAGNSQSSAANYQGETEVITDSGYIASLLNQIVEARCLLQVSVAGGDENYNSALLEVNSQQGSILLDELSPPLGHQRLLEQRRLTVSVRLRGIDIRFACAIEHIGGQQGIAFYRATLPKKMLYRQRRSAFRIKLGLGLVVPVHFALDDRELDGDLCDLSIGGIGANLHTDDRLERGQILPCCQINLPQGGTVQGDVEVRYVSSNSGRHLQHVGARFVNLTRAQTTQLERFVKEIEREMLRRNHKT